MYLKNIKIKWKLSILYTIILSLLILALSLSIYYFSYINFLRVERNSVFERLNMFLRAPSIEKPFILGRSKRLKELYIYNSLTDKIIQDPYSIGRLGEFKNDDIRKYGNEDIMFVKRRDYIIGYPVTEAMGFLKTLRDILTYFFIFSVMVAFGVSYLLAQKALKPIKDISREIRAVNISNLNKRLPVSKNGDEINELSLNLNEMLQRIQKGFEVQKQFINDVSHELRTPLTNFIGYVQLLKRWGYKDEKVLKESLDNLEKISFEMKELIENLLKLGREIVISERENINLNSLVKEAILEYMAKYPNYRFELKGKKGVEIRSSTQYLKMLLNILIDNAVKYSPSVKNIDIIIDDSSLSVRDYGMGIENTDKVFDRFYREDLSRNKKIPGFGIGLSIAKKIADALNIEIRVESEKGKGTTFELLFKEKP